MKNLPVSTSSDTTSAPGLPREQLSVSGRVVRTARWIRLSVTLAFAVALVFAPGLTRRQGLFLSGATLGYAAISMTLETIAARHREFPARVLDAFLGLLVITIVIVGVPRTMIAGLCFFALGIAFYTFLGGRTLGLWLSAAVVPCALVSHTLAPARDRIDESTLLMFVLALPVLAVVVDRLTAERRRTVTAIARLHDTIGGITARPDLQATLDSIAVSMHEAVGAATGGVVIRDGDRLIAGAISVAGEPLSPARADLLASDELPLGIRSPLGYALSCNDRVIADLELDPRFRAWSTRWAEAARALGCGSVVVIPLRIAGEAIGALVGGLPRRGGLAADDLAFLEVYAERAAAIVVRARAYEQERTVALELAATDRQKSEFLALVSHELRTPLTAVKGFIDTVLLHWEQLPDEQRHDLLGRASGNADELAHLVGQLLDFSRIDAARVHLSPQPLEVRPAVGAVLGDLTSLVTDRQLDVSVPDGLVMVADADAFSHVLVNLLTNAVKFSEPGSRVELTARREGDSVVVSVSDEGVGIALEERERIFDRFYQSPTNALSRRGTGIGLTVSKRFTELQGGRIWVDSEPGAGSAFSFTVPAAAVGVAS